MIAPKQHPLTLRFESDALESSFREYYARKSLRQVRYAMLLGVLFYGIVFGIVDLLTAPSHVSVAWTVRAGVSALALGVSAFSFSSVFLRYMQPVVSGLMLLAGWGLVLMLALDPSGENYYDGPVLIILATYVAVQLRFVHATVAGWLIVAAYLAVAMGLKYTPFNELTSNIVWIFSANVIGMFAGYMLEEYARREYWQTRLINEKRKENAKLLEARSRFFANVSHEFRTPLTLILGPLSDLLSQDDEDSEFASNTRRSLELVQRNAERLLRLINQLLDLAKLEVGQWPLEAREAPLLPFVRDVVRSFSVHAARKRIDLQFHVDQFQTEPPSLALYYDADKLEKVIVNLIANALKFTPEGGTVRVAVAQQDKTAAISVRDTGPGIAAKDLPHIFDRFRQADDSAIRQQDSTGIGLALAQEFVHLHHGTIKVESEPGFGTEFTVRLPLGRDHLSDDELASGTGQDALQATIEGETDLAVPEARSHEEATQDNANTGEAGTDEERVAILIVEDDRDVRTYIRDGLQGSYAIQEAPNGVDGLEQAQAQVPDLIITDVMMPGMDGYAFARALKASSILDHIPVIMLTAKAEPEHLIKGLETGVDAYVSKPFSMRELRVRIDNLLDNRRRLHQHFSQKLLSQHASDQESSDQVRPIEPSPVDVLSAEEQFVQDAQAVVENHIDDEYFNVDAFAEEMGMSRRQLQRKLKAVTDETPNSFIRLIRLGRGRQLVEQRYGTIAEIAYAVGFSSPSYFTKCFREAFGEPPSEYAADDPSTL